MKIAEKYRLLINNPILKEEKTIFFVWILTGIAFAVAKLLIGKYNNYKIFEWVYRHATNGLTLYGDYPEYYDSNHYGIIFSLIIAPFSILPEWLGMPLWVIANTIFLFYAIRLLPATKHQKIYLLVLIYRINDCARCAAV